MNTATKRFGKLKIALKYFVYYITSSSKHGVHSPLVFSFILEVLKKTPQLRKPEIEQQRNLLKKSSQIIDFIDYGKAGTVYKKNVSTMAKHALKSKKYAQLIARTASYYQSKRILELGTSLGITTAYLASETDTRIVTMEGDPTVASIAQTTWTQLGLTNIQSIVGNFDDTLPTMSQQQFDIIYIDGNHSYEPTVRYFDILIENSHAKTIFIFDDIHYSQGMEKAWNEIKSRSAVRITVDLFFLGYVFIDPALSKQDFVLRY